MFRDRLINEDDRSWYNLAVLDQLHTALGAQDWVIEDFADCLYGDFLTRSGKEYQELQDREKVRKLHQSSWYWSFNI